MGPSCYQIDLKLSRNCALSLWHVVTAIVIALRSLIKTESRTAKLQQVSRFTLPRLNWQMKQRMNEPIFGLLLSASLSLLDSFFPSGLLLRKHLSARRCMLSFRSMLALKFQGTWIVPSNDPFLHKQTSEKEKLNQNSTISCIFVKSVFAYLCQSMPAEESPGQHLFFVRSIPLERNSLPPSAHVNWPFRVPATKRTGILATSARAAWRVGYPSCLSPPRRPLKGDWDPRNTHLGWVFFGLDS